MFKKPLSDVKTTAPLRTSDRRKLKQRVLETYNHVAPEDGDVLVPEGLHHQKFVTYADDPGVAYFSMEGDPLWFTIGKDSNALIPTVYTLWKCPNLLPFLSTPAPVIPKLVGGADLMIPGVVQHSPGLQEDQLVAITQYHREKLGHPIAVGRMAVDELTLERAEENDVKGKAVYVLHTWKDALWEIGASNGQDVPEPRTLEPATNGQREQEEETGGQAQEADGQPTANGVAEQPQSVTNEHAVAAEASSLPLTPEDVSHYLRDALLQALQTSLASLPASSFPIPASTFWSSYILPARPVYATGRRGPLDPSKIDVKHSTHKSVKAFLKACAKDGLIKLKDAKGGDVFVTAVFPKHSDVAEHREHRTVKDAELKQQKAEDRERKEREAEEKRKGEIHITELWKPFGTTLSFFVAADKQTSELFTLSDIKTIVNTYIASKSLVNAQEQAYINVSQDDALLAAVTSKNELGVEFLKREEVLTRLRDHMQGWYEIRVEGKDPLRKKGQLKPVQVVMKIRQGRKACTLVTGFEPYSLSAEDLAEELRRICASSTSVNPVHGKASEMEVMVQGKQIKAVTDLLVNKGVPKKWIEVTDMTAEKKKK
ncbi:eukaryotic translation initiation factor SUI1 family protein [Rhodofomes roseus]|uniref:Eukaryotic translation initiation factor SUI1 family protein n=1 Tax=Rhodofomes roseus TaxID=34475 RepID=A0ABQ8KIM4_9APHY|nr:eukaryotic translation initiation factor SUI1 family protein [Rhodofomes roseus]KAH9837816.1 eukaryotic translation initiation factor SUI1 family protein [Rhodofomes roseus]